VAGIESFFANEVVHRVKGVHDAALQRESRSRTRRSQRAEELRGVDEADLAAEQRQRRLPGSEGAAH